MHHTPVKIIVCLFLFFGAQLESNQKKPAPYMGHAHQVMRRSAKRIAKELNLVCSGSGGGMPYNVREMMLKFTCYQEGSVELARELEVKATEIFLEEVNSHEKIRPFLDIYPFTPDRAKISIVFNKKGGGSYPKESIVFSLQVNNRIHYFIKGTDPRPFKAVYDEPYEEALKMVQSSQK
jgi:hypothetical protein